MTDAKQDKEQSGTKVEPWFPYSKQTARSLLPKDRPYTEFEAMGSLQLDHNDGNEATAAGYAKLWGWSRWKVRTFLKRANIKINYPMDTSKVKKQAGLITIEKKPLNRHKKSHINFIDFNNLQSEADIKKAIKPATTKENRRNKDIKDIKDPRVKVFQGWWFEKYRYKFGEDYIVTNWGKFSGQIKSLFRLNMSFEDIQYMAIKFFLDDDAFITDRTGHNMDMFLTRLGQNKYKLDDDFRANNKEHITAEPEENTE